MADTHPLPPDSSPPASEDATRGFVLAEDADAPTVAPGGGAPPEREQEVSVPGYEILAELGRGGMGVVYKARQVALDRTVALKMILAGSHASADDLARFRTEASALASLQHPNIVQIHEVGDHPAGPYFTLEFCAGGSLAEVLDGTPLPARDAAELLEVLARAIHGAHGRHLVHRDLKPANVLRAADGTPKITDFGLAKKVDAASHTQTGAVMGTPSYMAPEQASGDKEVGPAADIYALGALLYECLTGRPPFRAANPLDTLLQVVADDPIPPRRLVPSVPRDLETIALKCLQKEPRKRYASAEALADDLARWLRGEPIRARPIRWHERAAKWAARRPAVAGMIVVCAVVASVAFGLVTWKWREASAAHHRAVMAQVDAHQKREAERTALHFSRIALAQREWAAHHRGRAVELLEECEPRFRDWEWHYLDGLTRAGQARFAGVGGFAADIAYSPDGTRIACPGPDGTLVVRDVNSGRILHTATGLPCPPGPVAFHPDGTRLAVGVADPEGGKPARLFLWTPGEKPVPLTTFRFPNVLSVAFSPNGRWLAAGAGGDPRRAGKGEVVVWEGKKEVLTLPTPGGVVVGLAFRPDSTVLAAAVMAYHLPQGTVRFWELPGGKELPTLRGHDRAITGIAFDPEGDRLVTGGLDQTVRLWDFPELRETRTLHGPRGAVVGVAFSPDGLEVAGTSMDQAAYLWDVDTGKPLHTLRGHASSVIRLAYRPDGRQLATLSTDEPEARKVEVALWDVTRDPEVLTFPGHSGMTLTLAWSPDGTHLMSAGFDGRVNLWEVRTRRRTRQIQTLPGLANAAAFHPDGKSVATVLRDGHLTLVGLAGQPDVRLGPVKGPLRGLTFSPMGHHLAVATGVPLSEEAAEVVLWDLRSRKSHTLGAAWGVAFGPRGRQVALGVPGGTIRVIRLPDLVEVASFIGHDAIVSALAFSPDGKRLASGSWDGTVRLWDREAREPLHVLRGHTGQIHAVSFGPEGRRLVSASLSAEQAGGGEVKLWDVRSGREALTLDGNMIAAFSPGGGALAALQTDFFRQGEIRVWESEPPAPLDEAARREVLIDWHLQRQQRAARAGREAGVLFHHDQALALDPRSPAFHAARAEFHAERQHWPQAQADYARALDLGSRSAAVWFRHGLVLALRGDRAGYREHCARASGRFPQADTAYQQVFPAWTCKLLPGGLDDYTSAARLAEKAVAAKPGEVYYLNNLAGILHRAGRHEEAIRRLNEALQVRAGPNAVWDWIWLALAHYESGDRDEARRWYEKADAWMKGPRWKELSWAGRQELLLLHKEAAGLLGVKGDGE